MTTDQETGQRARILEQFSRLAPQYAALRSEMHEDAMRRVLTATQVTQNDSVLDVACGTGQLALAFTAVANHVTGIDATPAMIERAQTLQADAKVDNIRWVVGDAYHLPFTDGEFSIVTCRYAFHHMLDPAAAVAEMTRVCATGGRVALVDVVTTDEKTDAFNNMERLRDPSHVRALTLDKLVTLAESSGLKYLKCDFYPYVGELELLLKGSSPAPGNEEKVRELIIQDIDRNDLGIGVHRNGTEIVVSYPIAIVTAARV
jgi:ubiquinone/menaquinone biosynthesis C-methylase UbiE